VADRRWVSPGATLSQYPRHHPFAHPDTSAVAAVGVGSGADRLLCSATCALTECPATMSRIGEVRPGVTHERADVITQNRRSVCVPHTPAARSTTGTIPAMGSTDAEEQRWPRDPQAQAT
jgi:hypothetical protein